MSRDAIYRYDFESPTNGWLYRLEMIPSDNQVFLTDPIGPEHFNYETFPAGCITVKEPEHGFDKLPLGMAMEARLSLEINLTALDTALRSYVWNPVTTDGGVITYHGMSAGDSFDTTRTFDTLNVWTLSTDKGTGSYSTYLFRGVQKPRIETELNLGTDYDVIVIDLVDYGKYLLEKITSDDVNLFMRSDEIDGLAITYLHTPDVKNAAYAFDYLYSGSGIGIYGKADFAVDISISGELWASPSIYTSTARFYKLSSLFEAITSIALIMGNSFLRQQTGFNLSGNPYTGLTFYEQDYTVDATRGAALAYTDLWYIGHVVRTEASSGAYEFVGGFLHENSGYGWARNFPTAWDLLVDVAESCGVIGLITHGASATTTLTFKKVKALLDSGGTLSLSDFVKDSSLIKITVGYECLRACKTDTIGMGNGNVSDIEYVGEGVLAESDHAIRTVFHNIPTLTEGYFNSNISFLSSSYQAILKEELYYANKIYYFDTPSFCTEEIPIMVHRTADYDNGGSSTSYGQSYTLPSVATTSSFWFAKAGRALFSRIINTTIIDMQRRDNISYAMARAVVALFGNSRQVLIENKAFPDKFLPPSLGEVYDFDLTGVRSWLTGAASQYVLVETTPDHVSATTTIKLIGV